MKVNLEYYKDLIFELTKKEIKVKYKSSLLGYVWSVAAPLSQAIIYYFAFKFVMRIRMENYALFLIVALFPWQCFANSVSISTCTLLSNTNLIKKTIFPREFLVVATLLNEVIHFILSLPVIFLFLFLYHIPFHYQIFLFLPILIIVQFIITLGICLFTSSINLFFRDLERLVGIALNILFFVSPIIYPQSMIPPSYRFIVYLNPIALLVVSYREVFIHGNMPWMYVGMMFGYGIVLFLFGYYVFHKLKWRFAEIL